MTYFGIFMLAIQVGFAVHAAVRDRMVWVFIVLFVPLLGWLVYFIALVLPELQRNARYNYRGTARSPAGRPVVDTSHRPQPALPEPSPELIDGLSHREQLAQRFMDAGEYEKAIAVYTGALRGAYRNAPSLKLGLAWAYFRNEQYQYAKETLENLRRSNPDHEILEVDLLFARILDQLDEVDSASDAYASLIKYYHGEEARCRYAMFLKRIGQAEKAGQIFEAMLTDYETASTEYQRAQRTWFNIARKSVEDMP